jgi:hypothetical protein
MKSILATRQIEYLPYLPKGTTYEFIDLRLFPNKIEEIPELKAEPALARIVTELNHPQGEFMTHKTLVADRLPDGFGDCEIPLPDSARSARRCYSSYVEFSFWLIDKNYEKDYKPLYDAYSDKNKCSVCFILQPAYVMNRQEQKTSSAPVNMINATVCMIWTSGWGGTVREAHDTWQESIQGLTAFFEARRLSLGPNHGLGLTVSDVMRIEAGYSPSIRPLA